MKVKAKGNHAERSCAKILEARFNQPFTRSIMSGGNREQGDILCPPEFRYTIEVKHGYNLDPWHFLTGSEQLNKFILQATTQAMKDGKQPLLLYRANRKPWLAGVQKQTFPFETSLTYGIFSFVLLNDLLSLADDFFFQSH
jgi:Holliday junction resolvase